MVFFWFSWMIRVSTAIDKSSHIQVRLTSKLCWSGSGAPWRIKRCRSAPWGTWDVSSFLPPKSDGCWPTIKFTSKKWCSFFFEKMVVLETKWDVSTGMYQLRTNGLFETRFWCFSMWITPRKAWLPERTEISTKNHVEFHQLVDFDRNQSCGISHSTKNNGHLYQQELSQLIFSSNLRRENHGWNDMIKKHPVYIFIINHPII